MNKKLLLIITEIKRQATIYLKNNHSIFPINIGYFIFFIHTLYFLLRFLYALYRLDHSQLHIGILYIILCLTLPPILYLCSTKYHFYNYYHTKLLCFSSILFQTYLIFLFLIYRGLSKTFLPNIMHISVNEAFTKNMVLLLGRLATQLPLIPIGFLLFKGVFFPVTDSSTREKILTYKITHNLKENKNTISYNMNIVRDIKTGKYVTVFLKDRFLHTLIDGTSGTGKTSSTILPAVRDDLNMHCRAEDIQKKSLKELEQAGEITYSPATNTHKFSINDFTPVVQNAKHLSSAEVKKRFAKIEEKLQNIRLSYPVCGITILAPDDSLTDDVCHLCDAHGISYNRLDMVRDQYGKYKKNYIGINPFYVPTYLKADIRNEAIVKKAVIFSDVMQAITDLKGKADSYFTGLNRQMITNIAILIMTTVPILRNRQATPLDLQEIINNFNLLPEYVDKLEEIDKNGKQYTFIIQYVREDLLGKGRSKMEDQSRGTRNIINEFLLMPANKEIFSSQTSIDFDRALENGEVTVCNYNLASGDSNAIAFGLFFLFSYNNAVLSRPGTESTRTPHFFYVDEFPVLIHPSLEKNFSLFRKYRVAMTVAIQTLDQMQKNEITKYLQGVILGSANIIVFGRSSLSDMEIFSSLAGVHDVKEEQNSISETALTDNSPHLSFSSREMITQKNRLEEIEIRMRDFQEVTFFTTKNGRPLPPIHGKVNFLNSTDWEKKKRNNIYFTYVPNNCNVSNSTNFNHVNALSKSCTTPDFLPSTPISYFQSSATFLPVQENSNISTTKDASEIKPDGSETIDDILQ